MHKHTLAQITVCTPNIHTNTSNPPPLLLHTQEHTHACTQSYKRRLKVHKMGNRVLQHSSETTHRLYHSISYGSWPPVAVILQHTIWTHGDFMSLRVLKRGLLWLGWEIQEKQHSQELYEFCQPWGSRMGNTVLDKKLATEGSGISDK